MSAVSYSNKSLNLYIGTSKFVASQVNYKWFEVTQSLWVEFKAGQFCGTEPLNPYGLQ